MADNRLDEAIKIVARHVIARAVENITSIDHWEFYDEVGEHDWHEIADRAVQLAPYPDRATYQAAYDYLTGRAEH